MVHGRRKVLSGSNAWFTFSLRQHEMRWEQECEGYIHPVCHFFDQFLSRLEALGNMSVNQSRVKGNKNVSNVSPRYRRYCDYILIQFLNIDYGLKFSEKCGRMKLSSNFWNSRLSGDFRALYLSRNSRIRVRMSTFVCTSSHSLYLESLDEYPRRECKPSIIWVWMDIHKSHKFSIHTSKIQVESVPYHGYFWKNVQKLPKLEKN